MEKRRATRTVLLDNDGKVAILYVGKLDYYKIPGGGVDEGEDLLVAAKREVREEAGCDCEIIGELDEIVTEIPGWGMLDISTGYAAKVVGEKSAPEFDEFEQERGFEVMWVKDLDEAIRILENHKVVDEDAALLQGRDLEFLRRAAIDFTR